MDYFVDKIVIVKIDLRNRKDVYMSIRKEREAVIVFLI